MEDYPIYCISAHTLFNPEEALFGLPQTLHIRGSLRPHRYITIVGSRECSAYGIEVCKVLIAGLAGYPLSIVSGLARGIDTIVHETCLKHNIHTIAFPGSGLHESVMYPVCNKPLAEKILQHGGALISEYESHKRAEPWMFPKRNRLEAALSHMTLVIEAQEKSGSLITAQLACDYNKVVGAVPGSIFSSTSFGTNQLISEGAIPITTSEDILDQFSF